MIRKAESRDLAILGELAAMLWPHHAPGELEEEFALLLDTEDAACFLAWEGAQAVGFAQCQLRRDYVEGTETSPVGYLEGIFVAEDYRGKGIARSLLAACESWVKEKGCGEFASDCQLDNKQSLAFHLHVGFAEANRIICFTKKL